MLYSYTKKIALLKGITSKHKADFYCLNCLHSFRTKSNSNLKKGTLKQIFCGVVMPSKDTKLLEFNQYWKSDKMPSIIYADLVSLIKKSR